MIDINKLAISVDRYAHGCSTSADETIVEDFLAQILLAVLSDEAKVAEVRALLVEMRRRYGWPLSALRWGVAQACTHPGVLTARREIAVRKLNVVNNPPPTGGTSGVST